MDKSAFPCRQAPPCFLMHQTLSHLTGQAASIQSNCYNAAPLSSSISFGRVLVNQKWSYKNYFGAFLLWLQCKTFYWSVSFPWGNHAKQMRPYCYKKCYYNANFFMTKCKYFEQKCGSTGKIKAYKCKMHYFVWISTVQLYCQCGMSNTLCHSSWTIGWT